MDEKSPLRSIYPPVEYAIYAPISLFLVFVAGVVAFTKSDASLAAPPAKVAAEKKDK